jgi:Protein of unknown function (DUF2442)
LPLVCSAATACNFVSKTVLRRHRSSATSKFRGVFEPLRDATCFAQVRVDPQLGTMVWPNGADLDPDVLYGRLTGTPALQQQALSAGRAAHQAAPQYQVIASIPVPA